MSAIEEIKARLDIVGYVGQFVQMKKAGRHYQGLCPFHTEKSPSFMVDPDRQTWHCYGACATGGDVIAFAQKKHGWGFGQALEELGKLAGVQVKRQTPGQKQANERAEKLYGLCAAAAEVYHRCLLEWPGAAFVRDYITGRGLTAETVASFQLGYAPDGYQTLLNHLRKQGYEDDEIVAAGVAGRSDGGKIYDLFRNRLIVPIRDERGRVVSLAGRAMKDDQKPKYLNGPETAIFSKSHVFFGYNREACREQVIIVEGYMDAMQAHQAGFKNVVAQMGTALAAAHLKTLRGSKQIILALDGDAAGQAAATRSIETLVKSERDVRVLSLSDGKDPDDVIRDSPDGWRDMVAKAEPVADYIIRIGCQQLPDNASVQQRVDVVKALMPLLLACESEIYKLTNMQALALRLRLPVNQVLLMASGQRPEKWTDEDIQQSETVGLETGILRALAQHSGWYDLVQREFRLLKLPPLEQGDFSSMPDAYGVFSESLNQFDLEPLVYLETYMDGDQWAIISTPVDFRQPADLVEAALQLRLERLASEADYLIAVGNFQAAQNLLVQKSAIEFRHL